MVYRGDDEGVHQVIQEAKCSADADGMSDTAQSSELRPHGDLFGKKHGEAERAATTHPLADAAAPTEPSEVCTNTNNNQTDVADGSGDRLVLGSKAIPNIAAAELTAGKSLHWQLAKSLTIVLGA